MAYKPTVWVDGETPVNAENLNKLENGVAAAVVSVNGTTPDENGNVAVVGGSGEDGFSPIANVTQTASGAVVSITDKNGITTATIANGKDGDKGDPGKTPVKGVDYFTDADKAEMVEDVLEALNKDNEIEIITTEGGYYTTAGVWQSEPSVTVKHTDLIPVSAGDKFTYTGVGAFGAASVLWYNSEQQLISYEQHGEWNVLPSAIIVTAPASAAYVRFCGMNCDKFDAILEVSYYEEEVAAPTSVLAGRKIVYDGDSICYGAGYKGGYAKLIANKVNGIYENQAVGGARLITLLDGYSYHSIVDNLPNLPKDGDLYCFDGGVNDYWTSGVQLGSFDYTNFTGDLDKTTVCGALETIFRYCLDNFVGKPICFVIVHKVQEIAYKENSTGKTFKDYRDAMIGICEKYSIPYYDAFSRSGLNGWNAVHNQVFFTDGDGSHPTEEAYKRYYVPQLISLFESMMPEDVPEPELPDVPTDPEAPTEPTYTNLLDEAGYKSGVYLSNGNESADANAYTTGFMEVGNTGYIYLKNVTLPNESSHGNRVALYNANKEFIAQVSVTTSLAGWEAQFDSNGNLIKFYFEKANTKYMRISSWGMDETSIITVNEPIN